MTIRDITDIDEWERLTEELKVVEKESIVDQSRWQTFSTMVVYDEKANKYYRLNWSHGSTENQEMYWEDEQHTIVEVKPIEVTVTKYVVKKD